MMSSRVAGVVLAAVDGAALVALRPRPGELLHHLTAAGSWIAGQPDAALAQLAGAALWLVAAWLGLGLLAGLLAHLPGTLGAVARRVATVALPRVLQHVVIGSLGVGIVLTPLAASAGSVSGAPQAAAAVPSPTWPTSPPAATPAPRWPVSPPTRPAPTARPAPPARPTPATPSIRAGTPVDVRSGDTLWQLAADRLGPTPTPQRVSHYWQRIYAANRAVIGGDPDRIHPGQRLLLPAPTAEDLP